LGYSFLSKCKLPFRIISVIKKRIAAAPKRIKPNEMGDISATLTFAKIGVKHAANVINTSSK
jgi:hypothetical protein